MSAIIDSQPGANKAGSELMKKKPANNAIWDRKIQVVALSVFGGLLILSGLPFGIGIAFMAGSSTALCLAGSILPMIAGGLMVRKAKEIEDEKENKL